MSWGKVCNAFVVPHVFNKGVSSLETVNRQGIILSGRKLRDLVSWS